MNFADYKRFLECYMGDDGFRERFDRAPEAALREAALLAELEQRAGAMGANAVIGVDIDYEVLGADNGMLMVTASGTAVVVD